MVIIIIINICIIRARERPMSPVTLVIFRRGVGTGGLPPPLMFIILIKLFRTDKLSSIEIGKEFC
jgi:hypothetical protein